MYICTLFLTSALDGGWVVNATPRRLYPREWPGTSCKRGWLGPRAGLGRYGKSRSRRDSIRRPSSPSESLYRLRYPGPLPYCDVNEFLAAFSIFLDRYVCRIRYRISPLMPLSNFEFVENRYFGGYINLSAMSTFILSDFGEIPDPHVMLVSMCGLCENRHSEGRTFLISVCENTCTHVPWNRDSLKVKNAVVKSVLRQGVHHL